MQQDHENQSYRTLEHYTASLAMLEEQNRQRRHLAREDQTRQHQTSGSSSTSPVSPSSATSNGSNQWYASRTDQSQDAIQQYQQMLLEEQRRRNQELGRDS